jgi:peptidoglycan/LPS O-acetylase OafA/YrhL
MDLLRLILSGVLTGVSMRAPMSKIIGLVMLAIAAIGAVPASAANSQLHIYANGYEGIVKIPWGTSAGITWSAPGYYNCGVYGPEKTLRSDNVFNGSGTALTTDSQRTGALTTKSFYTLSCTANDGSRATTAIVVQPSILVSLRSYLPTIASSLRRVSAANSQLHIYANGQEGAVEIPWGTSAGITWSAPGYYDCGVYGPQYGDVFNGSGTALTSVSQQTYELTSKSFYTLYCLANDGLRATKTVIVKPSVLMLLGLHSLALASSLAFYAVLLVLALPWGRRVLGPRLAHPIPPSQHYLQSFDAIRGFAAGLVAIGHCWWATYPLFAKTQYAVPFLAYDSKAVPMFAVLSGFLIYRSVAGISSLDGLRSYAIRRFFRIYPVYVLGVLLSAVFGQYVASKAVSASALFAGDFFMLNNVNWLQVAVNPPTWSLYIETTFYAFLPLVVLVVGRHRMLPFAAATIVVMMIADISYRQFELWPYFLIGIIASDLSPKAEEVAWPLFALGAAMLVWDFGGPANDWFAQLGWVASHGDGSTVGLGLACMLLLMTLPHLRSVGRIMHVLPLRLLGVISYSVYVTHFFYILAVFPEIGLLGNAGNPDMYEHFRSLPPMPGWYMPLLVFPGVFFWGLISFLVVERPGIRFGRWIVNRHRLRAIPPTSEQAPVASPAS